MDDNKDQKKESDKENPRIANEGVLSNTACLHSHPIEDLDSKLKCNICFELPEDPVVTRCGHLYCWACLHTWLQRGSVECPVCKAGVSVNTVVPVYGSESDARSASRRIHPCLHSRSTTSSSKESEGCSQKNQTIPERPRAERLDPPQSSSSSSSAARHGLSWGMHSVQFGLFPFGIGVQFGSSGMMPHNVKLSFFFKLCNFFFF